MREKKDNEKRDARIFVNRVLIYELLKREMKKNRIDLSELRNFDQKWGLDRAGNLWSLQNENAVYGFSFYVVLHSLSSWTMRTRFREIKQGVTLSSAEEDRLDAELRESIYGALNQMKREFFGR